MEATTTVQGMLRGNQIKVPDYQRAYAWEKTQCERFLRDLEEFLDRRQNPSACYYLGHFLFEQRKGQENTFAVIDGQQRLTTTTLCLAALFRRIKAFRDLTDEEQNQYEDMICRRGKFTFKTVSDDRIILCDCLDLGKLKFDAENEAKWRISGKRVAAAARFFNQQFARIDEARAVILMDALRSAVCTTHCVEGTGEAAQMFLLQNDRGKPPTNLEVVKSMLLRTLYLECQENVQEVAARMNDRFRAIYTDLASLEGYVEEDAVLSCAWKIEQKDLTLTSSRGEIEKAIDEQGANRTAFVEHFAERLQDCAQKLVRFYHQEPASLSVQTLRCNRVGVYAWGYPFIVQAYTFLDGDEKRREQVWRVLESLTVRHWFVGGRAQLDRRLQARFSGLDKTMDQQMKDLLVDVAAGETEDGTFWYWSDDRLREMLSQPLGNDTAKFALWRYDSCLKQDDALRPDLSKLLNNDSDREHIAPWNCLNATYDHVKNGYGKFSAEILDLLGNTLVLPPSLNRALQDASFQDKFNRYTDPCRLASISEFKRFVDARREQAGASFLWDQSCVTERTKTIVERLMTLWGAPGTANA